MSKQTFSQVRPTQHYTLKGSTFIS